MKKYTTFYLEEDIVERLNQEKNKSAIVNSALRVHFMMKDSKPDDMIKVQTEKNFKSLQDALSYGVDNKTYDKSNTASYCPNGHPIPVGRDRCMGKGCKHS